MRFTLVPAVDDEFLGEEGERVADEGEEAEVDEGDGEHDEEDD